MAMANEDLTTDIIYKKLAEKAKQAEKERLDSLWITYHENIGLGGSCEEVKIKPHSMEGGYAHIYTTDFLEALTETLVNKRAEGLTKKAVDEFIDSVKVFKEKLNLIESYQLAEQENEEIR